MSKIDSQFFEKRRFCLSTKGPRIHEPSGYPAVPKAASHPILPSMRYCSGYPASGVLRPLILAPCILFRYPPWASIHQCQYRGRRVWESMTYRIDYNSTSRIGVGLCQREVTLPHMQWIYRDLVAVLGSGTGHCLPSFLSTENWATTQRCGGR